MKTFRIAPFFISIIIFCSLTTVKAQAPSALNNLKKSVSLDFSVEIPVPSSESSCAYIETADELSGEKLFQYLHKQTAPSLSRGVFKYAHVFEKDNENKSSGPVEYTEAQKIVLFSEYTKAKSYMYAVSDNIICNERQGLITLYSQLCVNGKTGNGYDYNELGDANKDGIWNDEVNTEHIWPQSFFNKRYPMRADIHHLYPTLTKPNGMRSNYPFSMVPKPTYSTSAGSKRSANIFEPCDQAKGNVARGMMYFIVRYYDKSIRQTNYNDFWVKRVPLLLKWHKQDPPDANEIRRNNLIEKFQGNRNPFIDNPSLADKIGAKVFQSH